MFNPRLKSIYALLKKQNLDCLIVSSAPNISYLTACCGSGSCLLVSKENNVYFTDSRYIDETRMCLKGIATVEKIKDSFFASIAKHCRSFKFKRIGFEEQNLSFSQYGKLRECLGSKINLIPTSGLVEGLRQIKTETELKEIKKAVDITIRAIAYAKNFITPGKKEIEVAAELERFIRYNGAASSSFNIIVASGPNSSVPHHLTSQRIIRNNESVLIDMGVDSNGYKSDLTRVFFLGKINNLYRKIYDIVLKAQSRAIEKIRPAVNISKIDAASRQFITQRGYGRFFVHALGHGVGLEVHEAPRISAKENITFKQGMVVTIEPGIYLPGKFGIRIEDMIYVGRQGCEVLSGALDK